MGFATDSLTVTGALVSQGSLTTGSASTWVINSSGVSTKYAGDTTAGNGLASVVGNVALAAQTATISATSIFTPPANGTYRLSVYAVTSTAGTGGTCTATLSWTDDIHAQTFTTSTIDLTTGGSFVQNTIYARAVTTAAIKYATTVAGATGSPQYALFVNVERLS